MYKKLSSFILLTFLFAGCANGDGLSTYGKNGYDFTFFSVKDKQDLIDVSNVLCQYSHGASKDCDTYLSPTYNFPKDSLVVQKDIVRSGSEAFKFVNGEGDCGSHKVKKWDDCKTHRERTEISMNALKTKDTWFKFSIFIPEESAFDVPISNTIWQIHLKKSPPIFMFRIGPKGDLLWADFVNNDFGGVTYKKILDAKFVKGQWNDFVVNIDFVKWPNKSYIKVWANDELKINYNANTTGPLSSKPYMKFGIYKSNISRFIGKHNYNPPKRGDTIVYYDAISIGNNCKQLNLEYEGNSCSNLK